MALEIYISNAFNLTLLTEIFTFDPGIRKYYGSINDIQLEKLVDAVYLEMMLWSEEGLWWVVQWSQELKE